MNEVAALAEANPAMMDSMEASVGWSGRVSDVVNVNFRGIQKLTGSQSSGGECSKRESEVHALLGWRSVRQT